MPSGAAKKDGKKEKDLGSLRLKVQCHEERILDSQLYSPFVQLMISAVESPGVSYMHVVSVKLKL